MDEDPTAEAMTVVAEEFIRAYRQTDYSAVERVQLPLSAHRQGSFLGLEILSRATFGLVASTRVGALKAGRQPITFRGVAREAGVLPWLEHRAA
ncbi:hypothetical protein ACWCOT_45130 [Nonomuraea bangladeshensis]